ncbi:Vacuolar protein sorting-associated protein 13B [Liparis tanakae]|uniref:Vacuolar protein sorting-associated protein 13B n=1 Tax=Liparis tanakae TaxID=230148 RepID=A0A4Z2EQA4_9TELE|nr:Vacuolar protein sorting-associated protein 13B [Liparis tanakae]
MFPESGLRSFKKEFDPGLRLSAGALKAIRRHQERRAILTPILTDFSVRGSPLRCLRDGELNGAGCPV